MDKNERVTLLQNILADLGCSLDQHTKILDVGCGAGGLVMEFKENGFKAYGCDLKYKEGQHVSFLKEKGYIKLIDSNTFEFPFEDNKFDVVLSDQVLEHVNDHSIMFKEIHRVLKPGGISLHIFPSCYMPIEPHVYVPLATIFQNKWWLYFWAVIGVRSNQQKGNAVNMVVQQNYEYLKNCTNYLTKLEMAHQVEEYFSRYCFCEKLFLKYSRRGKILYSGSKILPFLPSAYSALRNRVLAFWKD